MKKVLWLVGLLSSQLAGCHSTSPDPVVCQEVSELSVPSACYQAGEGLVFEATNLPGSSGLTWIFAPLKDTVVKGGETFAPRYFTTTTNRVVVPDSIVSSYALMQVYVFPKNCSVAGARLHFSFVKRTQPNTDCTTWHLKDRYVVGD